MSKQHDVQTPQTLQMMTQTVEELSRRLDELRAAFTQYLKDSLSPNASAFSTRPMPKEPVPEEALLAVLQGCTSPV